MTAALTAREPDWRETTFGEAVEWAAIAHGAREALVHGEARLTYAELAQRVRDFARGLVALGVRPGDHVCLWMPDCIDWVVARWAVPYMGAVLVPINTRFRDNDVGYVLKQSDSRFLIVDRGAAGVSYLDILGRIAPGFRNQPQGEWQLGELPRLRGAIGRGADLPGSLWNFADVEAMGRNAPELQGRLEAYRRGVRADDVAQILYTSGTTSFPKGAMVRHGALLGNNRNTIERFDMTPADRYLAAVPLFSATGTSYTLSTLICGCAMVLADRFDPQNFCRLVEREKITFTFFVDAIVHDLREYKGRRGHDLSSLRTGTGGPLSRESFRFIVEELGVQGFTNVYGMSETSNSICRSFWHEPLERKLATNGQPMQGVQVHVVDVETGEELPFGRTGELRISGYTVMKGYYNRPEENAKAFDARGRLCTGDLGELTEDGYVVFRGRVKEMIKPGGFNVATQEIEEFLLTCPGVKQAVVVGVPDARLGEVAYAYVQAKEGETPDGEAIIARCKQHIAGYKVPRFVELIGEFPYTSTGKIKKLELKELAKRKLSQAEAARPLATTA
ncbi:MAG: class I adenylate-forming enzyme family protein [Reyranellaceae bacterium]